MATFLYVAAIGGFLLLLVATVILVVLNRSEKTITPVVSIFVVGTATTLATVILSLKESTIESAFPTSVVLDSQSGMPPMIQPDLANLKTTTRLSELFRLGHPVANQNGRSVTTISQPTNLDEKFSFCGELLQYRILLIINQAQRGGWSVNQYVQTSSATVSKPMKLSNLEDYPGKKFLPVIATNRFFNSDMQRFEWEHGHFPLPKKTEVSFVHVNSSPDTGPEKYIVRLRKPLFFQLEFIVEPLGGTGIGVLPAGLNLDPVLAARSQTLQYKVTMEGRFEKLTSGNSQTLEYKEWANWLYGKVSEGLSE